VSTATYVPSELDNPLLGLFFGEADMTDSSYTNITPWYVFCGQNIKGTPHMPAAHAGHDIKVITKAADICVLQEFKWEDYWKAMTAELPRDQWHMYPSREAGLANPVDGAQANLWRVDKFSVRNRSKEVLMPQEAGISETRWLRAVLLASKANPSLMAWYGTTHFVVGGDESKDEGKRKTILSRNIGRFDAFLSKLEQGGFPIIWELDANIHSNTNAFKEFDTVVRSHKGIYHGHQGVEYCVTFNNRFANVEVKKAWTIPTSELFTDHEGRLIQFRLTATSKTAIPNKEKANA